MKPYQFILHHYFICIRKDMGIAMLGKYAFESLQGLIFTNESLCNTFAKRIGLKPLAQYVEALRAGNFQPCRGFHVLRQDFSPRRSLSDDFSTGYKIISAKSVPFFI